MKSHKMKKLVIVLVVILLALIGVLFFLLKDDKADSKKSKGNAESETMTIETDYCDLRLPVEYENKITANVKDDKVEFIATEDKCNLFTLYFNDETDVLLGTLKKETDSVVLYADFADLDDKNENYESYCEYQEAVNFIIENLEKEYEFVKGAIVEADNVETFDIETDVVTLKYPKKWEEKVTVEVTETKVSFTMKDAPIFDICFEEGEGTCLGFYNDTPVCVVSHTIDEKQYSEDEYLMMCEMQEDVNVIINNLVEDENFQ